MSNIANVVIAADATVKVGKATFKVADALKHASALYDNMWLIQNQMLDSYKEIGQILLGLQALFGDNRVAFGKFLEGSELGAMSRQDRSDAMFLATNWTKVQNLNKTGTLDTLGVSAIRKRLKAAEGKASGAGVRKADQKGKAVTEGKAEAEVAAEPKVLKFQTEEYLAAHVLGSLQDNGLDFVMFAKALAALRKGA
jgi:hypothetical protein